ncbi:MAG: cob(I)yrinic acid a,c-diamide adenosyltransferase [Alphaproteobacteria bacterium]|jgi:cob(I)alamin adenosyltransferase|nr:cob(I)yrinic acid a,c-diamide adenosyltransferase [Alphaproteobacteria bacterium]
MTDAKRPPNPDDTEANTRADEKSRKRKAARDKMLATKTIEKGLLIVHTGKGKGKSTAAFGLALRALGRDKRVGVIQFVKGVWETGEREALRRFEPQIEIRAMGEGFTWDTQDRARDIRAARSAWEEGKRMLSDPSYDMVILDELNIVLRYDYLELDDVLAGLANRPAMQHAVVTGRNAKEPLIEAADLVTEMTQVKHPFRSGVKAQIGIEF